MSQQKNRCLLLVLLLLLLTQRVFAQVPVDSIFLVAQNNARLGHYNTSRMLLRQVLAVAPSYSDATVLIGRTYAWEEKFDSARAVLVPLYENEPSNTAVLLALADVALWSKHTDEALAYASQGLETAIDVVPFLYVQARAHEQRKEYKQAEVTLERILGLEPTHPEASKLLKQVKDSGRANLIGVSYQVTAFNKGFASWQLGTLEYIRNTPKSKYVGRVSYADRYEQQSMQYEIDAYPVLTENAYLYLNAGFSDGRLFPEYRAGAELYHMLPHKFEVSAGARLLSFPEENVVLFTGYIGKYFKKQWIAFRPFLQQTDSNWQTTGILLIRNYFKHADDHVTLVLSQGSTPLMPVGLQEISRLGASRIGIESQFRVGKHFLLGGLFSYEKEEYTPDVYRNRYTCGLSLQRKF